MKIVAADGKALTLAIPPGRRKYSRRMFQSATSMDSKGDVNATVADEGERRLGDTDGGTGATHVVTDTTIKDVGAAETSEKCDGAPAIEELTKNGTKTLDTEVAIATQPDDTDAPVALSSEGPDGGASDNLRENKTNGFTASEMITQVGTSIQANGGHASSSGLTEEDEDILRTISSLTDLENKIIDIDGRLSSKDTPVQNAWKNFRGIRDNQDLGSLFEMREEFYVYKHPKIVKQPKRKRK